MQYKDTTFTTKICLEFGWILAKYCLAKQHHSSRTARLWGTQGYVLSRYKTLQGAITFNSALNLSMYITNTIQHGKCFMRHLCPRWFVLEISLVHCADSFDFWYFTNLCVNTVCVHFPWSILYICSALWVISVILKVVDRSICINQWRNYNFNSVKCFWTTGKRCYINVLLLFHMPYITDIQSWDL